MPKRRGAFTGSSALQVVPRSRPSRLLPEEAGLHSLHSLMAGGGNGVELSTTSVLTVSVLTVSVRADTGVNFSGLMSGSFADFAATGTFEAPARPAAAV